MQLHTQGAGQRTIIDDNHNSSGTKIYFGFGLKLLLDKILNNLNLRRRFKTTVSQNITNICTHIFILTHIIRRLCQNFRRLKLFELG